jgi:hypothetical protein
MLKQFFRGMPGESKVSHRKYYIGNVLDGSLVPLNKWHQFVYPGAKLDMSMILSRASERSGWWEICPKGTCAGRLISLGNFTGESKW